MKNRYLVTVVTTQTFDGDSNVIEITTHGDLAFNNGNYELIYTEQSDEEGEIITSLCVDERKVITVKRNASINSCYIIEEGARHFSHHVASFGSFSVGISAKSVESNMNEEGGSLDFSYITDISGQKAGEVEFRIKVVRKK